MNRLFAHPKSVMDVVYLGCNGAVLSISFAVPAVYWSGWHGTHSVGSFELATLSLSFAVLLTLLGYIFGLPWRMTTDTEISVFGLRLALALAAGGVAALAALKIFLPAYDSGLLLISLSMAFAGAVAIRAIFRHAAVRKAVGRRLLVLGVGTEAWEIGRRLSSSVNAGGTKVSYYNPSSAIPSIPEVREGAISRHGASLSDVALRESVSEIVVAVGDRRGTLPLGELLDAKLRGIQVSDLVSFYEREFELIRFDYLNPSWVVFSPDFQLNGFKRFLKRAFDLVVAGLMFIVSLPVFIIVIVAIIAESRGNGPIFYYQKRVGYRGEEFLVYKFRTMCVEAERDGVAQWARKNDSRVTRVGRILRRFRLDELPQLVNILRGDMSLVGPRPERPEFVRDLEETIPFYSERHCVKPGLSGWAQLMYPYGSSVDDAKRKLEYDLYYIKHVSLMRDLVILVRTLEVVLLGRGVR